MVSFRHLGATGSAGVPAGGLWRPLTVSSFARDEGVPVLASASSWPDSGPCVMFLEELGGGGGAVRPVSRVWALLE